jgi:molybdopterin molybdotransferase
VITSLTETDGFLELPEEMTEIAPGAMAGFLSYQSLIN